MTASGAKSSLPAQSIDGSTEHLIPKHGEQMAARPLRILIATDAWQPQVNGVVRTLETLARELENMGHEVRLLEPSCFRTVPLPTYREIQIALNPTRITRRIIESFKPDAIHIATEGPIGFAARRYCVVNDFPFTTSFHTRFPEYIHARTGLPPSWFYRYLKYFHSASSALLVTTNSLKKELEAKGFDNLHIWARGVDVDLFRPTPKDWLDLARPVFVYVGRVAIEKNIEAFLKLDLPGTKMIVGDGPQQSSLSLKYPDACFVGPKYGDDLARHYAASDVFVFPSKTDTYGLVVLEALACGVPVAAYPVQGPRDIIGGGPVGALDDDLRKAALNALKCEPQACRDYAETFSWRSCTEEFIEFLEMPSPHKNDAKGELND
jgi:glycosyltransferase involved in cell wall biosynthesis